MSTILNNSIWPNTDGNLGNIKTPIPDGINTKWPDGDTLVGNFVYKNGKLAGFVDTDALILNDSAETTIPYDCINTKFSSILKDTIIINLGERCKNLVIDYFEDAAAYVKPMLEELLGQGNISAVFDKNTATLSVAVSHDTTDEQIIEVGELLTAVLPQTITIEYNPIPADYTLLNYVGGVNVYFLIDEPYLFDETNKSGIYVRARQAAAGNGLCLYGMCLTHWQDGGQPVIGDQYTNGIKCAVNGVGHLSIPNNIGQLFEAGINFLGEPRAFISTSEITKEFNTENRKQYYGQYVSDKQPILGNYEIQTGNMEAARGGYYIIELKMSMNDNIVRHFFPVLDELGNPGLYDCIKKEIYYHLGTGQLVYSPANAAPIMTASLDEKLYAELTEHGVRRLYHVPENYNGTKDEYAAEHGFKELVEPPMPLEGYWTKVWKETDSQLICEWVETEPPIEEESDLSLNNFN